MQAPLAFQLVVRHFGVWRSGRCILMACAATVLALWVAGGLASGGPLPWAGWCIAAAALAFCATGARPSPVQLRWDGQTWFLRPLDHPRAGELCAGHLSVAIDAGPWLLLRWVPNVGRSRWLPVQRRGHEARWHLLRCTVHGARRVTDPLAAAAL